MEVCRWAGLSRAPSWGYLERRRGLGAGGGTPGTCTMGWGSWVCLGAKPRRWAWGLIRALSVVTQVVSSPSMPIPCSD